MMVEVGLATAYPALLLGVIFVCCGSGFGSSAVFGVAPVKLALACCGGRGFTSPCPTIIPYLLTDLLFTR